MREPNEPGLGRAAELRRAFDLSFAAASTVRTEEVEDLLALRVRGDAFGLRVRDIGLVAKAGRLAPLPSQVPELLGLAGIRGMLVPVYSLAGLLGFGPSRESPRWLAIAGKEDPLALSIGEFEGYLRLPRKEFHAPDREARNHVDRFVKTGQAVRAVINVASLVASVKKTVVPPLTPEKGRAS